MNSANKGRLMIIGAAICWGLAGVCVKSITWSSMSLMSIRSVLAILLLFAFKGSFKVRFKKENIMGALMTTITGTLYIAAIKLTTAGTAIVLQYIAPILVFLYAVIFQKRKPKLTETVLTLAVFGGILLSFADSLDPTRILGNLLGLLSGVSYAAQIIIQNGKDCDSEDSLIISCMISFAICSPFLFFDKGLSFDMTNIIWILVLGFIQYGMGSVFFSKGCQSIDKLEVSLLLTIEPIFNPIPVAIFCGEMMGPMALIGSAVVIVCVALYGMLPALEKRKIAK